MKLNFYQYFIGVLRYLRADLMTYDVAELDCKFDVILVDPPLEEYQRRDAGVSFNWKPWSWEEVGMDIYKPLGACQDAA